MAIDPKILKIIVKKIFPRYAPCYAGHVKIDLILISFKKIFDSDAFTAGFCGS